MVDAIVTQPHLWRRRAFFFLSAVAIMAVSLFWGRYVEPPSRPLDGRAVAALVGAVEVPERLAGRTGIWRVRRGAETLYAAESFYLAPGVRGYGGPLNVLVVIDADGNFDRLVVIRHRETPSYVADLREFLSSFGGLSAVAPLAPGDDVDAMSRATISSDAFAAAARVTGRKILKEALGRDVPVAEEKGPADWRWAVAAAAFFAAACWARRGRDELLRLVFLVVAVGVWGFWAGRFIGISDIGRVVLGKFPPLGDRLTMYVLLGVAALLAWPFGNVYCGWLCPFGALTEVLYKIPIPKVQAPASFARRLGTFRLVVLAAALGAIVATRELGAATYEPFDDIFARVAAGWSLAFLLLILLISVVHYRFFCRYLCAAGALLGEVAALACRSRVPNCERCGNCAAVCPSAAIISRRGDADLALCNECGRCRVVCRAEKSA